MKSFNNKVAAITGAGSGMGRTLALDLARRGCHLALSDVNEPGLAETVQQVQQIKPSIKVTAQRVDVADRVAVFAWADQVAADHGKVNLIFNNAGVGLGAAVDGMKLEDFEWLMNINFWGVVHGTQAFLPHLKAAGEGHIINTSSLFGLLAVPSQSAYNAAKFAVRGFTESLSEELRLDNGPVRVTCVHPGGIDTNIVAGGRVTPSQSLGFETVEQAARDFKRLARTSPEAMASSARRSMASSSRATSRSRRDGWRGSVMTIAALASARMKSATRTSTKDMPD